MIEPRELILVRAGDGALILFLPMLLLGMVLYGRIAISSQSDGVDALRRVADAGVPSQ